MDKRAADRIPGQCLAPGQGYTQEQIYAACEGRDEAEWHQTTLRADLRPISKIVYLRTQEYPDMCDVSHWAPGWRWCVVVV